MDQPSPEATPGRPREIFAWALYDWANSAFSTILITIMVGYIQQVVVPGKWGQVAYTAGIAVAMLTVAVLSPILGALADANCSKRKWLALTAFSGAGCGMLIACLPPSSGWLVVALFVITSLMFDLSLGFYNGFLPEIADQQTMNRVSAWGYTLGYLGGAIALVLALLVTKYGPAWGLPSLADRLRVGILIMGLWWGGFSIPTIWILRDRGHPLGSREPIHRAAVTAFRQVGHTLSRVRVYRILALFLLAFLLYNDGVQSVINLAGTFALNDLHFGVDELAMVILMIQFMAMPGAMLVGWLSDRIGQKATLMGCLVIWVGVVLAAWFIKAKLSFWILGAVVALVMGGTQSVSRAMMGYMTPPQRTAEFFGFFNLSGKASSCLGLGLCAAIIATTGSIRGAIISLLIFFLVGGAIVAWIDVAAGRRQAMEA
jgi:UMF1 family MFS transporter